MRVIEVSKGLLGERNGLAIGLGQTFLGHKLVQFEGEPNQFINGFGSPPNWISLWPKKLQTKTNHQTNLRI